SRKVYPQSVSGPYRRAKWLILFLCLGIYYLLPFLRWDRGRISPTWRCWPTSPITASISSSSKIWPQEVYYFTGLLILAAFFLFLMNAVAGRVWCGYLCPQTVWTDLFLAVERFFEGDRRERMRFDEAPWSFDKLWRKVAEHAVWLVIAWWTGGAWVLYFADAPTLVRELATFTAPLSAYVGIVILTFTTYSLAGIMREQVCKFMCPWPRIQAALTDDEALNVTYRYDRGEPRVSVKQALSEAQGAPAGDCIDCYRCVAVCPVGIDIREGAQIDCTQCGLCIDACDTVMAKIERPKRLIAYDTEINVKRRIAGKLAVYRPLRTRTVIYAALILVVGGAMLWQPATRRTADISVLHERARRSS
ncbi:cytochrome c oxidase accessory protein CcoG, partial [Bosea thiooxidans]